MNWLAHLRLAAPEPLALLGNLCGDFVRGVDVAELHPDLQRGIAQHRAIDRFVDAHPVSRRSRQRLRGNRFAAVLVDVFYDHFLARDWHRLGDGRPLPEFAAMVHGLLDEHRALLPPRLQRVMPWMRDEQWLLAYADLDGIDGILQRMSGRTRHREMLRSAGGLLRAHYDELAEDFGAFWPEVVAVAVDGSSPRHGDSRGRQSGTASR